MLRRPNRIKDITGQKFNLLLALSFVRYELTKTIWLFRCDCGNEIECVAANVISEHRKSCGCLQRQKAISFLKSFARKPKGDSVYQSLYTANKRVSAKHRGLVWTLTLDDYKSLVKRPCLYCGSPPHNCGTVPWNEDVIYYSGLDRLDNSKGYKLDNVVPCCRNCNIAKNNLSLEDFVRWISGLVGNYPKLKELYLNDAGRKESIYPQNMD